MKFCRSRTFQALCRLSSLHPVIFWPWSHSHLAGKVFTASDPMGMGDPNIATYRSSIVWRSNRTVRLRNGASVDHLAAIELALHAHLLPMGYLWLRRGMLCTRGRHDVMQHLTPACKLQRQHTDQSARYLCRITGHSCAITLLSFTGSPCSYFSA